MTTKHRSRDLCYSSITMRHYKKKLERVSHNGKIFKNLKLEEKKDIQYKNLFESGTLKTLNKQSSGQIDISEFLHVER